MPEPEEITPYDGTMEWFGKTLKTAGLQFLLAFADDRVILGRFEKKKLFTTSVIDRQTLQRAHLFGKTGELRLLRNDAKFEQIWLDDDKMAAENLLDECYPIWREGQQGLNYSAPAQFNALEVRHTIRYDGQGQAYFSHSRLVAFSGGEK